MLSEQTPTDNHPAGGYPGRAYDRITTALQAHNLKGRYQDGKAHTQCPAHQDRNPSLSITRTNNKTLIHCHANCTPTDILAALELTTADLFDYDRMQWNYTDPTNNTIYRTVSRNGDKQYRQNVNDPQPRLLNLERIEAARLTGEPIYLVEGEKDADTITWLGHTATTAPMGAANFHKVDVTPLTNLHIIAIVDKDEAGANWATQVETALKPITASLTYKQAATGKDITDHTAAGHTLDQLKPYDPKAEQHAKIRELLKRINWHELWEDEEEEEWLLYPLIPARRLIALFSAAKTGKSLLMLEIAAALSTGRKVLGYDPGRRIRVLYIDFENDPRGDVRTRLQDMGYEPGVLDYLDYLSFPSLPYLDSGAGASALLAAVEAYGPELVVIDTISRAVQGEENDNNTWLNLYKHTGLALKQAQVAMIRLDHTGKDETKGQRGGSAKSGDVDAIWKLSTVVKDERYRLECLDARFSLDAKELVLIRHNYPLHHSLHDSKPVDNREARILDLIEKADADTACPRETGGKKFREWLTTRGIKARKDEMEEAIRRRKAGKPTAFQVPQTQNRWGTTTGSPTGPPNKTENGQNPLSGVPQDTGGTFGGGLTPRSPTDPPPYKGGTGGPEDPAPCPECGYRDTHQHGCIHNPDRRKAWE